MHMPKHRKVECNTKFLRWAVNKYHSLNSCSIPYMAKLSRGNTFAVVHKTHYSLGNFRGASGLCHYVLYTANDSRGKLSQLAKKLRKFSPSKVLPYTVNYSVYVHLVKISVFKKPFKIKVTYKLIFT